MTPSTRYECCLCPYVEEGERSDISLIDHLVRAHDLDRDAVLGCECRPLRFEDGPDFYRNTCGWYLGDQRVARTIVDGPKLAAKVLGKAKS
jgi:hypothetical protein